MVERTIREQLIDLSEEEYRKFAAALIPNISNVLGVRLPALRKLARNIAMGDWRTYLAHADNDHFEEIMLQGMVIGSVRADTEEILRCVDDFVPKIDNWSVCDSFCNGLKFTLSNKERVWDFILTYLSSNDEYDIRFGVVMLLNYYIEEAYIHRLLQHLDNIKHDGYYVKMAVAWAISICYVKLPETTTLYLNNNSLDDFTFNKALQKITESVRVDQEAKQMIRGMKKR